MNTKAALVFIFLFGTVASGSAQEKSVADSFVLNRGNCKNNLFLFFPGHEMVAIEMQRNSIVDVLPMKRIKFIEIHGNVNYDYFYRSNIDTPFAQSNLQQHTERLYLDVVIKEKYPLKVNIASRQSNSPYFRNFIDVNFNFDRYAYQKNVKQQILNGLKARVPQYKYPNLGIAEAELTKLKDTYSKTKNWLENPANLQKIVEERERNYYKKMSPTKDTIGYYVKAMNEAGSEEKEKLYEKGKEGTFSFLETSSNKKDEITQNVGIRADSVTEHFSTLFEKKRAELDSLEKKIVVYKGKADSIKKMAQQDVLNVQQRIYKATSEKELRKLAIDNGIDLEKQSKLEKQLGAIKSLSVGRTALDYTELTAQNITVTGINVEYNPSYYVAIAAGKIDYRFRDFLNRGASRDNSQYIVMGRLGVGEKEHHALILSYFTGRKSTSRFGLSDSINSHVNIMGYSLEAIYKKDEYTGLSAEFAKSTKPVTGNLTANKESGSLIKFNDETNMGINIKAQTIIPETNTKLSGFYRKTGENFQSFSLFSYNTDQTAWLARVDQSIWKNKVSLTGMLRRNDFTNPFTDKTYKTSTIFKSVLLNIRIPKYPSVTLGYYPGTQIYMIDKEKIRESAYYIFNGSIVYSYFFGGVSMNSSIVYNRYSSEATDSGFIAYKGINYYASQSVFLKKLQLQAGYAYTKQPLLEFYTLETSGNYSLKSWLKAGIGVKYNNVAGGNHYWGQSIQLRTDFKKLGGIQVQYEKSYLPTIHQTLFPVEIGRVSYYKNF